MSTDQMWDDARPPGDGGFDQGGAPVQRTTRNLGFMHGERYDAIVVDHAMGNTSTGAPQLAIRLRVEGVGFIAAYLSFSDAAYEWTEKKLASFGWNANDKDAFANLDTGMYLQHLAEKKYGEGSPHCQILVEEEEYEGQSKMVVKWIDPPGGGTMLKERMTPDQVQDFESMMRARIRSGSVTSSVSRPAVTSAPRRTAAAPPAAAPPAARPAARPAPLPPAAAPAASQPVRGWGGPRTPAQHAQTAAIDQRKAGEQGQGVLDMAADHRNATRAIDAGAPPAQGAQAPPMTADQREQFLRNRRVQPGSGRGVPTSSRPPAGSGDEINYDDIPF